MRGNLAHHRRLLLPLFVLLLLAVPARLAVGCPFCAAVSLTFAQEIDQSAVAVIARLVEPPPASALSPTAEGPLPQGRFAVVDVLKGDALVRDAGLLEEDRLIEAIMIEAKPVGEQFLLMAVEPPELIWSSPIAVSDRAIAYLKKIDRLPESGPDRLAFFQQYLEDEDDTLARDAYDEFAVAPYKDVQGLETRMDPTKLLEWIESPSVPANRRRLYATMLGISGTPADAERIERILLGENLGEDADDIRSGLDALIACYVVLRGPTGLDLIDSLFLDRSGRDVPFTETYAAVMALRFLGEESAAIPRERVLESLRLLLNEPKLADLVIADLARWSDWSVIDRLTKIYADATPENLFVREPIVNYMKACPLPAAAAAMNKLREIDPEAVRRAATLAGLAGLTTAPAAAPEATDDETAPVRVADVVADDITSDSGEALVVSPGSNPAASRPVPAAPAAENDQPLFRWGFWVLVVLVVAFLSRAWLRAGASKTKASH